jgi:hypothetical protein
MERPTSALQGAGYAARAPLNAEPQQRRSVTMQSTPLIAFDQHAATTVAAVLLPGHRTPALHTLSSDSPIILRFVKRFGRDSGAVRCCYEAGPCGFELQRTLTQHGIPCEVIAQ